MNHEFPLQIMSVGQVTAYTYIWALKPCSVDLIGLPNFGQFGHRGLHLVQGYAGIFFFKNTDIARHRYYSGVFLHVSLEFYSDSVHAESLSALSGLTLVAESVETAAHFHLTWQFMNTFDHY